MSAGRGEAGPRGDDVRSDAHIAVELRDSGGVEIALTSKVGALYGDRIREQVEAGCRALGVDHARVEVEDVGALPFVLDARLEAAVRAAGHDGPELLPERHPASLAAGSTARDRLRRSRLYLPGGTPKYMINAALHAPDAVILDLEDSVAPSEKAAARLLVRNALRFLDWADCERMVRINQLPAGLDDLPFVVGHGAQLILIPKTESADQVVAVAEAAATLAASVPGASSDAGVAPPWIMPILESAAGIQRAEAIAAAHPTVVALTIGLEDYTADIGAARTPAGTESFWARSMVVAAARAAGVQPIDSVHSDVSDPAGLEAAVREARSLGFEGKGCIHPRQIPVVHRGFDADDAELAYAQRVVRAFAEAQAQGVGVVSLGSKMIDPPVVKRAQRTVDLAVRSGRIAADWAADGEES
ncbi:MAG: citrate lyase ACP [Gemmatimonadetes bacterium]|nr:citrate lyase ACP [Gemmatimonadota bacterium]